MGTWGLKDQSCIESFVTEKCLWCFGQSEVAVHAQHVFEKTQKLVDRVSFGLVEILIKIRMNPDHANDNYTVYFIHIISH